MDLLGDEAVPPRSSAGPDPISRVGTRIAAMDPDLASAMTFRIFLVGVVLIFAAVTFALAAGLGKDR
jgi:hypothetical protein